MNTGQKIAIGASILAVTYGILLFRDPAGRVKVKIQKVDWQTGEVTLKIKVNYLNTFEEKFTFAEFQRLAAKKGRVEGRQRKDLTKRIEIPFSPMHIDVIPEQSYKEPFELENLIIYLRNEGNTIYRNAYIDFKNKSVNDF